MLLDVNKTVEDSIYNNCYVTNNLTHLQCLFSYQIFTSRSLSPDVANKVPSGLKARCCTGVAVFAFQTHCQQACSCSWSRKSILRYN